MAPLMRLPGQREGVPDMAQYLTRKGTKQAKVETLRRRAIRKAKQGQV
jgi:hypothetical protein